MLDGCMSFQDVSLTSLLSDMGMNLKCLARGSSEFWTGGYCPKIKHECETHTLYMRRLLSQIVL